MLVNKMHKEVSKEVEQLVQSSVMTEEVKEVKEVKLDQQKMRLEKLKRVK